MADCFFHTGRPAVTRCKQCGKPLCGDCRHITQDGVFCSDTCAQRDSVFEKRAREMQTRVLARKRSGTGTFFRLIIFLAVLFIIFKVVMHFIK